MYRPETYIIMSETKPSKSIWEDKKLGTSKNLMNSEKAIGIRDCCKDNPLMIVARNFAPSEDRSCSSSMNGSNLEQIVHNRIGRHSLEWVEIWNQSLWCNSLAVSCNDGSSRIYLHNHMKTTNKIKKHQNMIHYSMLMTKEFNNKIYDNNTIYFMGKKPILH